METRHLMFEFNRVVESGGLVRSNEVARALGISNSTVRELARTGKLTAYRIGGQLLFDPDEVTQKVNESRIRPQPKTPSEKVDLKPFLAECCEMSPGAMVPAGKLYQNYLTWAKKNKIGKNNILTKRKFGLGLTDLGFRADRSNGGLRVRRGLCLMSE